MWQSLAVCWRIHHPVIEKDVSEAYQYYLVASLAKAGLFYGSFFSRFSNSRLIRGAKMDKDAVNHDFK